MNSITSVALIVILSSAGAFCFPSQAGAAPTRSSSNKVYVSIGGQLSSFSPAVNEDGLLMQSEVAQNVSETHLRFAGALQRIVRIAVDVQEWENSGIIAIAVEEKVDSGSLGYRFLIGRWSKKRHLDNKKAWTLSDILIKCPATSPFNGIFISLPKGDSVMMTLQRMTRKKGTVSDKIETHTFLNHCPVGPNNRTLPTLTQHYGTHNLKLLDGNNAKGAENNGRNQIVRNPEQLQTSSIR